MRPSNRPKQDLQIVGYGGIGEIGGNKFVVRTEMSSVILDFGMSFGAEGRFFEEYLQPRSNSKLHDLLRLNLLPKLDGVYRKDAITPSGIDDLSNSGVKSLWKNGLQSYEEAKAAGDWTPDAVFISHAHLDHIAYLPYLGNIPIIWSPTTERLAQGISEVSPLGGFDSEFLEIEQREIGYTKGGYFPNEPRLEKSDPRPRTTSPTPAGQRIAVGDDMEIETFNVGHSIPGAQAALVETPDVQLVYTGDVRFHGLSDYDLGDELQDLRPDIMMCEGTRITEDKPDSEAQVKEELTNYVQAADGLALVAFAWKDLERYETLREVAKATDRELVVDPRLAYLKACLGGSVYKDGVSAFVERSNGMLYSPADYTQTKHKIGEIPISSWDSKEGISDTTHLDNGTTIIDINEAPSQYILQLDYYRFKNLIDLNLPEGSIFVRAQTEPFNEEMELSEARLCNWLRHFNLNAENDHQPYQTHASGHAAGVDLLKLIDRIKPRTLIPIHTEHPEAFDNPHGDIVSVPVGDEIQF